MGLNVFPPSAGGLAKGNTAARPSSPVTGDAYYNGERAILEIYNGTTWVPTNAKPETPTIALTDVGTNVAYGAAQASVAFTANVTGGSISSYNAYSSTYSATSTSNPVVLTVGDNGSYTVTGTVHNAYGISPTSASATATLTTVPQTPSSVTATISTTTTDITVAWTIGANGGKAISALKVVPYLNGTTAQTEISLSTSATSTVVTGLTSGNVYTFKVYTTNANGNSALGTSNSVTVPTFFNMNYLVVAGGGGGGGVSNGAGGGAGGVRSTYSSTGGGGSVESTTTVPKGSVPITVTVGAGGGTRTTGSNSVFNTITAAGGGGGGRNSGTIGTPYQPGQTGGSGGGGASAAGGSGTANQGYAGGTGSGRGGGGGGAGGVGGSANGGSGISNNITGSSVSYAGGGGGGGTPGGTASSGGGAGVENATANNGTANTGGGGGGRNSGPDSDNGGSGGSGIVILRWPTATATITIGAGLTGSTSTVGSDTVATITAGTGNVSFA